MIAEADSINALLAIRELVVDTKLLANEEEDLIEALFDRISPLIADVD